jgi:hypothetical protein
VAPHVTLVGGLVGIWLIFCRFCYGHSCFGCDYSGAVSFHVVCGVRHDAEGRLVKPVGSPGKM